MRIIGGRLKGLRFNAPANLPVRPTTDMAKEALFNILHNSYDLELCRALDLFCGTGNISIELASRDVSYVKAIDKHMGCTHWVSSLVKKHDLGQIEVQKADVFKFLKAHTEKYDIIFADPPYDLPNIAELAELVMDRQLLNEHGILIIEHPSFLKLDHMSGFSESRKYGNSSFSFFKP